MKLVVVVAAVRRRRREELWGSALATPLSEMLAISDNEILGHQDTQEHDYERQHHTNQ